MRATLIVIAALVIATPALSGEILEKSFKVESGQRLYVDLDSGGSILITGWNKNEVVVKADLGRFSLEDCDIVMQKTDEGVEIESERCDNGNRDFRVHVPEKFDLELHTMGGTITIRKVEGDISGQTMGGNLDLRQLKGDIRLKTMGGDIVLVDSNVDGKVTTMGGRVLLEDVVGDVDGTSMGGNVIYRNVTDRKGKTTGKVVNITTMGGDINVDDASHGASVHTMGGEIHIRSAADFIKAKTMGGDIRVDAIDGWIRATTMGGDIEVTMVGDPKKGKRDVTLTSMGGDIELTVPDGLSMEIDIELAYTKSSTQDFEIFSDFDLDQERTDEWDTRRGSPRKYIYGKATIEGGKNKVKIETINGNVYLRKGK